MKKFWSKSCKAKKEKIAFNHTCPKCKNNNRETVVICLACGQFLFKSIN